MSSTYNPYESPSASLDLSDQPLPEIIDVAKGQKLIMYAILVNFSTVILQMAVHPMFGLMGLVALVMGVMGILKMSGGLGLGIVSRILIIIGMIIPLVNLIVMLSLNGKATKELQKNGYKVGLLGAKGL